MYFNIITTTFFHYRKYEFYELPTKKSLKLPAECPMPYKNNIQIQLKSQYLRERSTMFCAGHLDAPTPKPIRNKNFKN